MVSVRVHLWDLSGGPEYQDVRNELYANTDAIFLVYDMTDTSSFDSLSVWMKEVARYCSSNVHFCLVSNKVGYIGCTGEITIPLKSSIG